MEARALWGAVERWFTLRERTYTTGRSKLGPLFGASGMLLGGSFMSWEGASPELFWNGMVALGLSLFAQAMADSLNGGRGALPYLLRIVSSVLVVLSIPLMASGLYLEHGLSTILALIGVGLTLWLILHLLKAFDARFNR